MKKIIILSLYIFSAAGLFTSCSKDVNGKLPENVTQFPTPLVVKKAGSDQNITASNPNAFSGKVTVGLYFPNGALPKKYDVVVIKNNDKTKVKTIQADLTTFPSDITVTGTQLATLFGAPIVAGDRFDVSVDVTISSGEKFEAFPVTGNAYAAGIAAQPGSSTFVRYNTL